MSLLVDELCGHQGFKNRKNRPITTVFEITCPAL
uniref:Uncharacterized protein n=1 Tax=Arundo donax TaxID=35708 RepID=A0A0A9HJK4_ARUDO